MDKSVFENTINDINAMFVEAEKMSCGRYCEGCLGCLTAYLIFFCMETHYEQVSVGLLGDLGNVRWEVKLFLLFLLLLFVIISSGVVYIHMILNIVVAADDEEGDQVCSRAEWARLDPARPPSH